MRVLVTGGLGYLGGRLAMRLAGRPGTQIRLATRRRAAPVAWLPDAEIATVNWADSSFDGLCDGVDTVVHLAGMPAAECVADPAAAFEFHVTATARLLRAVLRHDVRRFLYASTAHVYGSPLQGVIDERTCPRNLHPYAASHRAAEDIVLDAHTRGVLDGVVIRLSNAYGSPVDDAAGCWTLLVNDVCRQAVTTGRVTLHSSGLQRRDFIPMRDACRAVEHLLDLDRAQLGDGLFNVGGNWSPTVRGMAERVAARVESVTGRLPELQSAPPSEGEVVEPLDYRTDRLSATGFAGGGRAAADDEIDDLIRFCDRFSPGMSGGQT